MNRYQLRKMKIDLSDNCRLRCMHCSSNAGISGKMKIPLCKLYEILDSATHLGVEKVAFSGGEPLQYRNLVSVVKHAAGLGMQVSIYSTGNVPGFDTIIMQLCEAGVQRIIFSLFGPDQDCHEAVTQTQGSFDNTCKAISFAAHIGLSVELHFVPFANNFQELERIAGLGISLGVTRMSVLRFVPQGRGQNLLNQVLTPEQNLRLRDGILHLRKKDEDFIRTGSPYNFLMLEEQPKCKSAMDSLTVLPNLQIVPCDAFKRVKAEDIVGDDAFSSLVSSSLKECWLKSSYLNAVRRYLSTEFALECQSCKNLRRCHSGCLAQKFLTNGDLRKSRDPSCLMDPINTQKLAGEIP